MKILIASVAALSGGGLILALGAAARRGWPLWSASWTMFFWILAFLPLGWFVSLALSSDLQLLLQDLFLYLLLPLFIAGSLYWISRGDRLRGLLAALPILYLMWLPNMEQTPRHQIPLSLELAVKTLSTGLLTLAIVTTLRLRDWRRGFWILLGTFMAIGLQFSYVGIYHGGTLPFSAAGPSLAEVVKSFFPQYLAVCAVMLGPLFARLFRELGRRSGTAGKLGYHLALFCLLGVISANLVGINLGTGSSLGINEPLAYATLGWLINFGLGGFFAGLFLLNWGANRSGIRPDPAVMILLPILPLAIPLAFALPFITWKWPVSELYGVPLLWAIPEGSIYILGVLWLALSAWIVTRRDEAPADPLVQPLAG